MKYIAFIDRKILFENINNHPLFSYALTSLSKSILFEQFTLVVSCEFDLGIVSQYYAGVIFTKSEWDNKKEEQDYFIIDLAHPLIMEECWNGFADSSIDFSTYIEKWGKYQNFKVADGFDLKMAVGLICSEFCINRPKKVAENYIIESIVNKGKPKLLFTAPYSFFSEGLLYQIKNKFEVTFAYQAPKEIVKKLLRDSDLLFTTTSPKYLIDKDLLEGSGLKIVLTPSTGTNHVDVEYLENRNIKLICIKESPVIENIFASSEFSFTLLLSMVKKLPMALSISKFGGWRENEKKLRSNELKGKTIGLVGYGRIGKKMAIFSNAFGIKVIYFDPFVKNHDPFVERVETKEELLERSDIVSLHYHLTSETINSFGVEDFNLMKKDAYFLNTARGELVNEAALIEALKFNKIKAAAVDVITNEDKNNKYNHPLIKYARENDNLIVSPHIAGLTEESETKAAVDIFNQLERVLEWEVKL